MPTLVLSSILEAQASSGLLALFKEALNLVFPPACAGCGRVDAAWCAHCERDLAAAALDIRQRRMFEAIPGRIAVTGIHTGKLQDAVHALKYDHVTSLALPLGERLSRALDHLGWSPDIIIPIPLHASRMRERGYNQALLLAEALGHRRGIPCLPHAAQRKRDTRSQVGLNRDERRQNVMSAFTANNTECSGKIVLIVDDVLTTGATLTACATAVHRAGARAVYGLTVTAARD